VGPQAKEEDWGTDQRAAIEIVLRLVDAFNRGAIDELDRVISDEVSDHAARADDPPEAGGIAGRARATREALPDAYLRVDDMMVDGPKLAWRWTLSGTHRGSVLGEEPTGRILTVTGIAIERIEGGRIVEHWNVPESRDVTRQFQADQGTPPPRHA
jgi:predicted ester cyclase